MENKEKKVLNEEQLDVANGGRLFKKKKILNDDQLDVANGGVVVAKRAVANDDELDSVCGGAGKRCNIKADERQLGIL